MANHWIEFVKKYKKKYPDLKYSDLLQKASKSPEWIKYKEKNKKNDKKGKILHKKGCKVAKACPKNLGRKCTCDCKGCEKLRKVEDEEEFIET